MVRIIEKLRLFDSYEAICVLPRRSGLVVLAASQRQMAQRRRKHQRWLQSRACCSEGAKHADRTRHTHI